MNEPEFSHLVPFDRIVRHPVAETVCASEAERPAIARRLKIEAVGGLSASFELRYIRETSTAEIQGEVQADITQICVVTGEPFDSRIEAAVRSRFTTDPAMLEEIDQDIFSEWDDIELVESGAIDLGDLAVQHVALALDPYPRKPGVEWPETGDTGKPASPFAILQGLKKS